MNDAAYEVEKARSLALFEKWRKPLGLGYWRITYQWERESSPDSVSNGDGYRQAVAMRTYADWRYLEATIIVYLSDLVHMDDDLLEYTCVHEFMHLFLSELEVEPENKPHEERVATMLAKAFLWAQNLEDPFETKMTETEGTEVDG